jgi:CheY-like chemotaxis protein
MEQVKVNSILVVDDEVTNQKLIRVLLEPEGYVVQVANSGEAALASVAQQMPDLILLDVLMAGINGYEVTRLLKADAKTQSIPIIVDADRKLTQL